VFSVAAVLGREIAIEMLPLSWPKSWYLIYSIMIHETEFYPLLSLILH
jgi:hypothetical protein